MGPQLPPRLHYEIYHLLRDWVTPLAKNNVTNKNRVHVTWQVRDKVSYTAIDEPELFIAEVDHNIYHKSKHSYLI